jgi:hypothetical protein
MGNLSSKIGNNVSVSAVITRADGTIEDLGIIAYADNKKDSKIRRMLKWLMLRK